MTDAAIQSASSSPASAADIAFELSQSTQNPGEVNLHPIASRLPTPITGSTVNMPDGSLLMILNGQICRSHDNGQSWARTPLTGPASGAKGWEDLLLRTQAGTLLLIHRLPDQRNWEWDNDAHALKSDPKLDVYVTRSSDDGQTWSTPHLIYQGYCGCTINLIQTTAGRIVVPIQGVIRHPDRHMQTTCVSDDDGVTWQQSNIIDIGGHGHHDGGFEGAVTELADGKLWMLIRTNLEKFWHAFSDDQGLSWRTILPTDIDASSAPPNLLRLASGRLLLAWNRLYPVGLSDDEKANWERAGGDCNICKPRSSWHRRELSVAISEDDGKTFKGPVVLVTCRQCSYAMLLERSPGQIWLSSRFGPRVGVSFSEEDLLAACTDQSFPRMSADSLRNLA